MLAAERKVTSKLLEQDTSAEKLYILNEYVLHVPSVTTASRSPLSTHYTDDHPSSRPDII